MYMSLSEDFLFEIGLTVPPSSSDEAESTGGCLEFLCEKGLRRALGLRKNLRRVWGGVGQLCVITPWSTRVRGFVGRVLGSFSGWPSSTPEADSSCRPCIKVVKCPLVLTLILGWTALSTGVSP
jgi:hypothetical protein